MKLRSQILSFLFVFGLAPLMAAVFINIPLVFGSLELLYHKAHLQNLRADFRDLDQHLASRMEMVRLLAKMPDAEAVLESPDAAGNMELRTRYAQWVNRLLSDQLDIVQILFLSRDGKPRFWLERNKDTQQLVPETPPLDRPAEDFFRAGMHLSAGGVLISPISVNPEAGAVDPQRLMMLRLISPVGAPPPSEAQQPNTKPPLGAVVADVDVGGMARAYPGTYFVQSNGSYLRYGGTVSPPGAAFKDFPGLEAIFKKHDLALWKDQDKQAIWIPMFVTERSGPLWVGRKVDPSPLAEFRHALELRVVSIILVLIGIVLLVARWFAVRAERIGRELTDGIGRVLTDNEPVHFAWRGPEELRTLATNLTRLAETHTHNSRSLQAHARELEQSNRYKSEFLANVSHELRTPLNSILLLSKLLAHDSHQGLSPDQARQAKVIHEAGRDLAALIDNILDLSRIEAGKSPLTPREIDLPRLLEGLIDLVRPQSDEKHLDLKLEVAQDAPRSLISDEDKLRQILKNFLSNAVKFTATGGVVLRLQASRAEDQSQRPVRISVQDTGIGIAADKHEVVFQAFKQADGSTSRRYGGTGLGLTISRELAQLLGGRIELQSQEGRGSTFALLMPAELDRSTLDTEQVGTVEADLAPSGQATIPEADYHGRSVLVVDDDVRNLLALTPLLERWGLTVSAAGDGCEALETLEGEEPFDLVLMDIMLPEMDGNDTISQIRARERFHELPIVALTAKAGAQDRARSLAAGADDFLSKPVDPARLKATLDRFLSDGTTDHAEP